MSTKQTVLPIAQTLDSDSGQWLLLHDKENVGKTQGWQTGFDSDHVQEVLVPGNLDMIDGQPRGVIWYKRTFIPEGFLKGRRAWLTFGSVSYIGEVYVNGVYCGSHEGKLVEFTVEVTKALKADEENLIVVRVVCPGKDRMEGITASELLEESTAGGITRQVVFSVTDSLKITDVFAYGNMKTNAIDLEISSDALCSCKGIYEIEVSDKGSGAILSHKVMNCAFTVGENMNTISIPVHHPKFWSPDSPNLYCVSLRLLLEDGSLSDIKTVRTGFREFKVTQQGYFTLNGERVFLKCAHGGNHTPISNIVDPRALALNKFDIISMKATGFNCIRYLTGPIPMEILDFCDEIGLMVYQEHPYSWLPGSLPFVREWDESIPEGVVEQRFEHCLLNKISQDRNHPSIVIWGTLNETPYGRRYKAAVKALPKIRQIDKTRLVLLSSGSWDGDLSVGSVCNPFSERWECLWGEEGTDFVSEYLFEDADGKWQGSDDENKIFMGGYFTGSGDVHAYPQAGVNTKIFDWFENLGSKSKPVFLSEYGVGSQYDYMTLARYMESVESNPAHDTLKNLGYKNEAILKGFIKEFGLENIYPAPRDYILDSYKEQAKYREQGFSMIRSNPNIVGFSMTAVLDHGFAGEGFVDFVGGFKPTHMETMQDGWAPLRWCLLTNPTHCYANEPIRFRAVLANEDVLAAGTYPVTLKIHNDDHIVWKKECSVRIDEAPSGGFAPLCYTVFDEKMAVDGLCEGNWTFAATLEQGGFARGGKVTFDISDRLPRAEKTVYTFGKLTEKAQALLSSCGVTLTDMPEKPVDNEIILVGSPEEDEKGWRRLYTHIAQGGQAIFLVPSALTKDGKDMRYLSDSKETSKLLNEDGSCGLLVKNWEWLYHKTTLGTGSTMLKGMPCRRILDQNYFNDIISLYYFTQVGVPDESAVLGFAMGVIASGGVDAIKGAMLAYNHFFCGGYIFNCLNIESNIGHPAADRLLFNLIEYASGKSGNVKPLEPKAKDFIESINF